MKPIHQFVAAAPDVSRQRADRLIAWLRDYSEARIDSRLFDERRCIPPYVVLDFGNQGILGMQIPEQYGGLALRGRDFLRVLEQLAAIDLSLASLVFIHNANGIRPIMGYARPELRAELLPILAAGRELSAFALTEPAAGSNLPGIQTRAEPDGTGGWRLRGVKRWNASGWAGIVNVFARVVDEKGHIGHVTGFIVQQGVPGLRVGPESLTMGVRSIMQNTLIFDGVAVKPSHLLGEVGKGMDVADEALLIARLCMGAISLGGMKRCAQLMLRYASRRQVSTGRLLDSPTTLSVFSELTLKITAVQALVDRLVKILDDGDYPAEEACMIAKIVASDSLWQAADDLVETLGGRGYMENNIAPRIMRDCRMLRIGEGANELMTLSVGRRVLHSEKLRQLLRDELATPHLDELLRESAEQIMHRCLASGAPFADRGSAVAWAHSLTGQVAVRAVLLAALEAAAREAPSPSLRRAREWAALQLETVRDRAVNGSLSERLLIDPQVATDLITDYGTAIGDLEQAPAGIEEAIDPLLQRSPNRGGFAPFAHLPGTATGEVRSSKPTPALETKSLSLEEKRQLAAALLKKRLAASSQ
jgi:alkylation response protein AidB-like acyl-CoA dehydrogenase